MNSPCEKCGGKLSLIGYEQVFGQPESRRWQFVCERCSVLHEFDSSWKLLATKILGHQGTLVSASA